jgi:putative endonuclease
MYVYILTNRRNGTLYIGVTNDIERRIAQHKSALIPGFAQQHGLTMLVHVEEFPNAQDALRREKQLKNWHRAWKIALIEETNPDWLDLSSC